MKKLCIVADESIVAGSGKTGVGEAVDSLAITLANEYEVSVICPFGGGVYIGYIESNDGKRRMFGVDYYMVSEMTEAAEIIDAIHPDILHNWSDPEIICELAKIPERTVYTIEYGPSIRDPSVLFRYDFVTTVSNGYAKELVSGRDSLASVLRRVSFTGVTNGIFAEAFCPEKKVLTAAAFSADDLTGKSVCKRLISRRYGIPEDKVIFAVVSRMTREKGIYDVLDALPLIRELGGEVLFYGTGDPIDGAVHADKVVHPARVVPVLAGSDFLLLPSRHESCGLMPMSACRYGTIPITTRVGGLTDNMTDDISISCDSGVEIGIRAAMDIYADTERLETMRVACMRKDFSWKTRKRGYVRLYEAPCNHS